MERESIYRILFMYKDGDYGDTYYRSVTTQQAVDWVRESYGNVDEIIEVAKVVNNWK